jgi:hypothetical protein
MYTNDGQLHVVACKEVEKEIRDWMRGGGSLFPEYVMQSDDLFDVWAEYAEQHQNDLSLLR